MNNFLNNYWNNLKPKKMYFNLLIKLNIKICKWLAMLRSHLQLVNKNEKNFISIYFQCILKKDHYNNNNIHYI